MFLGALATPHPFMMFVLFVCGLLFIGYGVLSLKRGWLTGKFNDRVSREESPGPFYLFVTIFFLLGLVFVFAKPILSAVNAVG